MTLLGRLPSGQRSSTRRCWLAESTTCPTWSLWDLERVCFTCEFLPACAGCVCIWEPWVMPAPTPWMLPETECRTRTTAQTSQHPLSSVCSKGWFALQSLAEHRGVVLAAPLCSDSGAQTCVARPLTPCRALSSAWRRSQHLGNGLQLSSGTSLDSSETAI